MDNYITFSTYSPAADIVVMAVCLVMVILIYFSYVSRTRSFRLFLETVCLVFLSATIDILFYANAAKPEFQIRANWMRCAYHALLLLIFVFYIAYICEVTQYKKQRRFLLPANLIFLTVMASDVIITSRHLTFSVSESGISFIRKGLFIYAYLGYTILCVILMANVRKLVFRRIMFGFYGTLTISLIVLIIQSFYNQSSFTVSTLMFPLIAMMYVLHSNPYDAMLGSNDITAMHDYVKYCHRMKRDFVFMSLYMKEFDGEGKEIPQNIQALVRQFTYNKARKSTLFKIGRGQLIMIFLTKHYPEYEQKIQDMLEAFYPLYEKYRYDYKIVIGRSIDEISKKDEYVKYIQNVHRKMAECSVHIVDEEDGIEFNRNEYILRELADIYRRCDLDDPRVLVYWQPVLNVRTGKYDTAESLMRLNLKETGIVPPDQFIYLAEEQGYLHVLTQIILHKTCGAIRQFTDSGYLISRVSVNVSVTELKVENFCPDIIKIITGTGIPGDNIAIELTESQNEGDFMLMKRKIAELKEQGIKIYLDDFGTGYSSMERIMSLPVDVIKFDRSMVLASGEAERSRMMVSNIAHMFSSMNYSVLYEGIEKDSDETMCREMSASYLQGEKYSKPLPVMEMTGYLSRKES